MRWSLVITHYLVTADLCFQLMPILRLIEDALFVADEICPTSEYRVVHMLASRTDIKRIIAWGCYNF